MDGCTIELYISIITLTQFNVKKGTKENKTIIRNEWTAASVHNCARGAILTVPEDESLNERRTIYSLTLLSWTYMWTATHGWSDRNLGRSPWRLYTCCNLRLWVILQITETARLHNLSLVFLLSRCHFLLNCGSDEVNRAPFGFITSPFLNYGLFLPSLIVRW